MRYNLNSRDFQILRHQWNSHSNIYARIKRRTAYDQECEYWISAPTIFIIQIVLYLQRVRLTVMQMKISVSVKSNSKASYVIVAVVVP